MNTQLGLFPFQPTRQDIFNRAYLGVIEQGGPGKGPTGCAYFAPDGRMCGLGHAFGTEIALKLQAASIGEIDALFDVPEEDDPYANSEGQELLPEWAWEDYYFLNHLQTAHDRASSETFTDETFVAAFRARMTALAERYGLAFPEANQ